MEMLDAIAIKKVIYHFTFVILDLSLKKTSAIRLLSITNLKLQM